MKTLQTIHLQEENATSKKRFQYLERKLSQLFMTQFQDYERERKDREKREREKREREREREPYRHMQTER